jgi:hypothetical protein
MSKYHQARARKKRVGRKGRRKVDTERGGQNRFTRINKQMGRTDEQTRKTEKAQSRQKEREGARQERPNCMSVLFVISAYLCMFTLIMSVVQAKSDKKKRQHNSR